jgi:hypothetical protein
MLMARRLLEELQQLSDIQDLSQLPTTCRTADSREQGHQEFQGLKAQLGPSESRRVMQRVLLFRSILKNAPLQI